MPHNIVFLARDERLGENRSEMGSPCGGQLASAGLPLTRPSLLEAVEDQVASHRHWNAAGDPSGSRATRNADGIVSHQDRITATAPGWLVRAGDGGDLGFIGRPRRLDRVPVAGGGEERLPHGRVLDEVEQVGGVAPQGRRRGGAQLAPQLPG